VTLELGKKWKTFSSNNCAAGKKKRAMKMKTQKNETAAISLTKLPNQKGL